MTTPTPEIGATEVWEFQGLEGLDRLAASAEFSGAGPEQFSARLARLTLGPVVVSALEATPYRIARSAEAAASGDPLVAIMLVRAGRLRVSEERGTFVVGPTEAFAVQSDVPLRSEALESVQLLRAAIPFGRLPPYLRRGPPLPLGLLARTLLLASYAEFLISVIENRDPSTADQSHLAKVLEDLTVSLIAETQGTTSPRRGLEGMRYRIQEYVENNLGDAELSPGHIAAALGVSPRYIHRVFSSESASVSRYIRQRRVQAVAQAVRDTSAPFTLPELAHRHGFGGADQLVRAFRQHYGLSLDEYRTGGDIYRA